MEAKQTETGPEGIRVVGWDENKSQEREGQEQEKEKQLATELHCTEAMH